MLSKELLIPLAQIMECSLPKADAYFKHSIQAIQALLLQDKSLSIPGFGKFSVIRKAPRTGRNPKTGEPLTLGAKAIPVFKPSPTFKSHFEGFLEKHPTKQ